MAIAFDAQSKVISGAGGITSTTLAHTTTGTFRILFALVNTYNSGLNSDIVTGVTYAGAAMTFLTKNALGGTNQTQYVYYILNPTSGTNNIVATVSPIITELDVIGMSYNNSVAFGIPNAFGNNSSSSPLNLTTTTTVDNSWLVGSGSSDNGSSVTTGTATTLRTTAGLFCAGDSNGVKTPVGSYSLQFTGTTTLGGVVASFAPLVSRTNGAFLTNFL